MTLTAETASGFYYLLEANYFRKYVTDLREMSRIGRLSGVGLDNCREMGLRSLKGRRRGSQFFLFNPHLVFRQAISPKRNEVGRRSCFTRWLGSRVVSVLDTGTEGPGFKSQPRRCRVTVLGILFTPIVPLFTKQRNW